MSNIRIEKHGVERTHYLCEQPIAHILLAHGAGAGIEHEFMTCMAQNLAQQGLNVTAINFPYMQQSYELQKKRPPNRMPALLEHLDTELTLLKENCNVPIFIAGKSMGGRALTIFLSQNSANVKGGIVYGYPFIPPGKPEKLEERVAHFPDLQCDCLILQGQRDTFGNEALVSNIYLPERVCVEWVNSGDHSFKPLKSSGLTSEQNIQFAASQTKAWVEQQLNL